MSIGNFCARWTDKLMKREEIATQEALARCLAMVSMMAGGME